MRRWRAGPDSNRLPSAVLADVLPKTPPARIAATMAAVWLPIVWEYVDTPLLIEPMPLHTLQSHEVRRRGL